MKLSKHIKQYLIEGANGFRLADIDPADTGGLDIDKSEAKDMLAKDIKRLAELQALLQQQQRAFNAAAVGRTIPVLFEKPGRHAGQLVGRSPYLQPVHAEATPDLIGEIVPVRIATMQSNSLTGTLADEAAQ